MPNEHIWYIHPLNISLPNICATGKRRLAGMRVPKHLWLSLVAFQLWGVLEQLAPEIFLNYFFKTGDLSMVQLTQNMQKISKKWKKRQKCIDITLRKWSWRPLWQVGKKSISRFHSQPGALFGWFCNFPHQVRCGGGVENCQTTQKVHLVGCGSG